MNILEIQNSSYVSALQKTDPYQQKVKKDNSIGQTVGFSGVFEEKLKEQETGAVKFSKHALNRLSQRGIRLSEEQMTRLAQGMDKASGKGIKEPLVLIDDLAFIVSTDKKTVITAVDQGKAEDNIFTNIDGAVIN